LARTGEDARGVEGDKVTILPITDDRAKEATMRPYAWLIIITLALLGATVSALAHAGPLHDIQTVHRLLHTLQPWHGETETPEERDARLGVIATAIVVAAPDDREIQIALINQAWHETQLAAHVHQGNCGHYECDAAWVKQGGKHIRVWKARNLWQVHTAPRPDIKALWEQSLGAALGPTANAARLAVFYLRARSCNGNTAAMYSAQGGRPGCVVTPSGEKRAAMHRKLRAQWASAEAAQ
jgi:hypothetical protein